MDAKKRNLSDLRVYVRTGERRYAILTGFGLGHELVSRHVALPYNADYLFSVFDPMGREIYAPATLGEIKLLSSKSEKMDTVAASQFLNARGGEEAKAFLNALWYAERIRCMRTSTTSLSCLFDADGADVSFERRGRLLYKKDFVPEEGKEAI